MYENINEKNKKTLSDLSRNQTISTGKVVDNKYGLVVLVGKNLLQVNKAVSCLVTPIIGDLVSVQNFDDSYYITHVLDRDSNSIEVRHDGDMTIRTNNINLHADSSTSYISSVKGFFKSVEILGMLVNIKSAMLRTFSKKNENTHEEVVNKLNNSFTYVENIEETHSQYSKHVVKEISTVKAGGIAMAADSHVKIDAKNILLS